MFLKSAVPQGPYGGWGLGGQMACVGKRRAATAPPAICCRALQSMFKSRGQHFRAERQRASQASARSTNTDTGTDTGTQTDTATGTQTQAQTQAHRRQASARSPRPRSPKNADTCFRICFAMLSSILPTRARGCSRSRILAAPLLPRLQSCASCGGLGQCRAGSSTIVYGASHLFPPSVYIC